MTSSTRFLTAVALATLAAGPAAAAQPYVGISGSAWSLEHEDSSLLQDEEAEGTASQLTVGAELTDQVAAEIRYASGGEDTVDGTDVELDSIFSVLVKPYFDLSDRVRLYGLVGGSNGEVSVSGPNGSSTEDEIGFSYGIGAEARIFDDVWLTADYADMAHDSQYTFTATTVGLRVAF